MVNKKWVQKMVSDLRHACGDSGDEALENLVKAIFHHGVERGMVVGAEAIKEEVRLALN
ncbi:MAG: hypothetical protein GY861_00265 [bacterium]|nr:hypothetical protein [bacterium]